MLPLADANATRNGPAWCQCFFPIGEYHCSEDEPAEQTAKVGTPAQWALGRSLSMYYLVHFNDAIDRVINGGSNPSRLICRDIFWGQIYHSI